ncbi:MAG: 4'-phosphopantetheinyl transferase superfamily protein [Firmicutes bacterium]|jgi:phosphopantetheinyl transferase|nr:4'-phosphopantetheinyl transferase superfamily protein [Bacillota bacterium]
MILLSCRKLPEQPAGPERKALVRTMQRSLLLSLLPKVTGRTYEKLPALSHLPGGKPYFPDVPDFFFNFSDSGSFLILAAGTAPLGIDLQETASSPRYLALARRYFAEEEAAALAALPEAEGRLLFFRLWSMKEAYFKLTGEGIFHGIAGCTSPAFLSGADTICPVTNIRPGIPPQSAFVRALSFPEPGYVLTAAANTEAVLDRFDYA